ncbi:nucleotidyltransferase family protein [Thermosulfurimonas dismutans]|uniref:DNA polymerase, beta-like region n=1 Tax=Thermosulfurimonas dismutans TaxID=999894 RepID=A0A179D3Y3_9BACT|nr:nucleotidyltransferase family protein [Thermosulfurimonas dismutans]OAQ20794.1 DNA polymerase, beta-like region [Thermosulfurimonas dismutans]
MGNKSLEEIKRILQAHKPVLAKEFCVKETNLFGSYVRGEETTASDIDILVEFEKPIGLKIIDLKDYLEQILGLEVDVVSKKAVIRKPRLWQHIKEELVNV